MRPFDRETHRKTVGMYNIDEIITLTAQMGVIDKEVGQPQSDSTLGRSFYTSLLGMWCKSYNCKLITGFHSYI